MFTKAKIKRLWIIFSDADLVDIDFSNWDQRVSVYVFSDHLPSSVKGKRVLLAARFRGVRKFEWSFFHHDFAKFPLEISQDKHLQWNIYRMELVSDRLCDITLSGSEQFPVMKICFEDVDFEEIDHSIFAEVDPEWAKPGGGLGRPGIERLHSLMNSKRRIS